MHTRKRRSCTSTSFEIHLYYVNNSVFRSLASDYSFITLVLKLETHRICCLIFGSIIYLQQIVFCKLIGPVVIPVLRYSVSLKRPAIGRGAEKFTIATISFQTYLFEMCKCVRGGDVVIVVFSWASLLITDMLAFPTLLWAGLHQHSGSILLNVCAL